MIRKGQFVKVKVNYPRNRKVCGEFKGKVIEVGCFRTGYAYFRLDSCPHLALPNSRRYTQVIEVYPSY